MLLLFKKKKGTNGQSKAVQACFLLFQTNRLDYLIISGKWKWLISHRTACPCVHVDITQLGPRVLGLQTMKTKCASCQIKEKIYIQTKGFLRLYFTRCILIMTSRGQKTVLSCRMGNIHEETKKQKKKTTKKKAQRQTWRWKCVTCVANTHRSTGVQPVTSDSKSSPAPPEMFGHVWGILTDCKRVTGRLRTTINWDDMLGFI